MASEVYITSEIDDMARDMAKLVSLGINEEALAETRPTPKQTKDLLKGILYLREMYAKFCTCS